MTPQVLERIQELGYGSMTDLARAFPHMSWIELGKKLGIPGIRVVALLHDEAEQANCVNEFARSYVVREIGYRMPRGWGVGEDADFQLARGYAGFSATFGRSQESTVDLVWSRLRESAPKGWLPADGRDPIVEQAFRGLVFRPYQPGDSSER